MTHSFSLAEHAHRRFNPLTGQWILVSPHRTQRPWLGQVEKPPAEERPRYDPQCYLCPGNERAGGLRNPDYTGTFVFDNDFSALLMDGPDPADSLSLRAEQPAPSASRGSNPMDPEADRLPRRSQTALAPRNDNVGGTPRDTACRLLVARSERGICRVVCFSPRHDLTLAEMDTPDIRAVVDVWTEQFAQLGLHPHTNHVQIFENKGSMMGASNPHPHGQIWASETLPHVPGQELAAQSAYWQEQGRCLLCDVLALEERLGERIVCSNEHFVALVPFWATWPFEALLLARRHTSSLPELSDSERDGLADVMRRLTIRYDNLFEVSFPYSMGFHQAPTDGRDYPGWHLHAHYYPPLLRSATVRKFMVGYEMLAEPQRDILAEAAAARLRASPEAHYRQGK